MEMKYIIFVLCYYALPDEILAGRDMGPMGKIIMNSVYECSGDDKPKGDEITIKVALKNDTDGKSLDAELATKIALDDNLNFAMDMKRLDNGAWKNFHNVKGKLCRDFHQYFKKMWDKMTAASDPKLEKPCPIPAGTYKLSNFRATTADIETKTIFYGKLQVKTILTDKAGKLLLCIMGEGDSQPPA